eukprot:UN24247
MCVKLLFIPSITHIKIKIYCHYLTSDCHNLHESWQNVSDFEIKCFREFKSFLHELFCKRKLIS